MAEGDFYGCLGAGSRPADNSHFLVAAELIAPSFQAAMARDVIILECTEARAEGKQASQYVTTRNKKSLNTPGRLEKVKFNHFLKRRTLHRERR
ncbi:50S ribosomal protein L33 [Verrucomicrobiales bacterium]|nr:50S ribosomal protein L33 [Verrucomicrobiales bacterium]